VKGQEANIFSITERFKYINHSPMVMDKRRIAPTFMLPDEFPNLEVRDIYVVLRGGLHNVKVTSAQEFVYNDYVFGRAIGDTKGTSKTFRVDDVSLIDHLLGELVERNDGVVDYSMVLEQGQRAHYALKEQLQGPNRVGGMEAILRFTKQGELYLPRE